MKMLVPLSLLAGGFVLYIAVAGNGIPGDGDAPAGCADCARAKTRSLSVTGSTIGASGATDKRPNAFLRFFSSIISGGSEFIAETIPGDDPVKDAAVNEINALSKNVCNDENLPEDIWISPKGTEEDPNGHIQELRRLIQYCGSLKAGTITPEQKKDYAAIKKRLLEERRDLIRYYLETLEAQMEDVKEKTAADRKARSAGEMDSLDDEKIISEIEAETHRFYKDTVTHSNAMMEKIDLALQKYSDRGQPR